jgi:KH/beta-lactamase-domain protein
MGMTEIFEEIEKTVRTIVPAHVQITNIELEGSIVAIYTKNIDEFADNNDIIKQLAQALRRRVAIRPDPSILADQDRAEAEIRRIVPAEAQITDIYFEADTGEVTIDVLSPGIAIGRHGTILNEIKKGIGWAPKIVRAPPIPSKTVREIRDYLRKTDVDSERKVFLKKLGKRICKELNGGENWIRTTALGGYKEVGRSATLLSTRESKILVDCGVNVSSEDSAPPYLNAPELMPIDSIDGIVITHAHLDHCGLLPLLYKYGYDGPVYCTPPTRDLMSLLQIDYLKVTAGEGRKTPYESSHIREVVKHCIPLRYGETTDISSDIRLTFQNAGHILGSAIGHFHVGDGLHNIAVTGDIKYEKTWLFNPAVNKFPRLETLIIESTYGGHQDFQPSRKEAANQLNEIVKRTLARGGKVIVPVFAVGRSQEVMIVLEQLMRQKEILQVPVYLDGMIWEATAIHTAYPEYLNNQLREDIFQKGENPFLSEIFKRIDSVEMRENICNDTDPCIVLATSGMLNGGPIMEFLKAWGTDEKNTLVFVGYQAEGTVGRRLQKGWKEISVSEHGKPITVKINLDIETCDGFSGHSDRRQLMTYIHHCDPKPENVIVCHGEETKCYDLAGSIHKNLGIDARVPMNLETVRYK